MQCSACMLFRAMLRFSRSMKPALLCLLDECRKLWRLRALQAVMARRELAARVAGAAGGLLWVWLPPLATVAVYFLVFDVVFQMRLGADAPAQRVGAFLTVGMLAWMAFADALARAMNSLLDAGSMLQKNPLPPGLFVVRTVLASCAVFAPLLLTLVPLYAGSHHWGVGMLALPLLLAGQALLALLLGYVLAVMTAALRDVAQVANLLLQLGVFLSPILFPLTMFPAGWRWLLWLNPMTAPVLGWQAVLLQGVWPSMQQVWAPMAAWLVFATLALAVVLQRSREQLADWL